MSRIAKYPVEVPKNVVNCAVRAPSSGSIHIDTGSSWNARPSVCAKEVMSDLRAGRESIATRPD